MLEYLTYFYRNGQPLFESICDLDENVAEKILTQDVSWRGDGTYLRYRKAHERKLRQKFAERGGKPRRDHPIYMILGDSPTGPHDLNKEYDQKLILSLSLLAPEDVSFTYPDSLYEVPIDDLGRLHLDRNPNPSVFRMEELETIIRTYNVYEYNNHYVEAQVWNTDPLLEYAKNLNIEHTAALDRSLRDHR